MTKEDQNADEMDPAVRLLFETVSEADASAEPKPPAEQSADDALTPPASEQPAQSQHEGTLADYLSDETPPPAAKPAAKADAPAAEAPKADDGASTIKVRRKKDIIPPAPVPERPPMQTQPIQQAPVTPAQSDALDESELMDEERDLLEMSRNAERMDPARYKGYGKKAEKFFKDHIAYIEKARAENPEVALDENNPAYQAFLRANRINFTPVEIAKIERDRTRREVTAEFDQKLGELTYERAVEKEIPVIKAKADGFYGACVNDGLPEDVKAEIRTAGLEKAREKYGFEMGVAERVFGQAASDVEVMHKLTTTVPGSNRKIVAFDAKNEQHARILQFMNATCDDFERNGGAARMRDGKRFVTRENYFQLAEHQRAQCWTFSVDDVANRLQALSKHVFTSEVEAESKRLERLGFRRTVQLQQAALGQQPAAVPPAVRSAPAALRPAPAPAPTPNAQTPRDIGDTVFNVLYGEDKY